MNKKILSILACTFIASSVSAAPPTDKYLPGETIDPSCAPGDTNCDILIESGGDTTDDAWINNTTDGRVELGSKSDGSARNQALDFVITDDGKVGVGTFPDKPLTVKGGAHFLGGEFDIFPHHNNATTFFDLNNTTAAPISSHWRIFTGDYTDGSNDGFGVRQFIKSGGSSSRFHIANDGRVGIGTETPSDGTANGGQNLKLDIEGAVGATHYCDQNGENCSTIEELTSDVTTEKRAGWTQGSGATGKGKWAKIMTIDLASHSYQDGSFLLALSTEETSNAGTAIVSIRIRQGQTTGYVQVLDAKVMNKSLSSVLDSDSIKIVADAHGGTAEVYIRNAGSHQGYNIFELASNHEFESVSYEQDSDWSQTEPTGTYEGWSKAWDLWAESIFAENLEVEGNAWVKSSIIRGETNNFGASVSDKNYGRWTVNDFIHYSKERCKDSGGLDPNGNCDGLGRALVHNVGDKLVLNYGGDFDGGTFVNGVGVGVGTNDLSDGTANGGQLLKLDVGGAVGAGYYCDQNGENCSTAASLLSGGGSADNLGDHTATQNINLGGKYLSGDGDDEGLRIDGNGVVTSIDGNVVRRIAADTGAKDKNLTIFGNGLSNFDDGSWLQLHGKDHTTQPGVINMIYGGDAGELHIGKRSAASSDRVMTFDNNGNVGIGESDPQSLLDLKGSGNGQNLITLDGDGDGDHEFIGEYNEGIAFGQSVDDISDGKAQIFFAQGGQVGIGSVTPGATLSIKKNRPTLSLGSSDGDDKGMRFEYNEIQDQLRIQAVDANGINWSTTHAVFERDTGNVGINTLLPNSKLEVSDGYFELDTSSGQPPAADCDNANKVGRMKMDDVSTDLYVCSASGWVVK